MLLDQVVNKTAIVTFFIFAQRDHLTVLTELKILVLFCNYRIISPGHVQVKNNILKKVFRVYG